MRRGWQALGFGVFTAPMGNVDPWRFFPCRHAFYHLRGACDPAMVLARPSEVKLTQSFNLVLVVRAFPKVVKFLGVCFQIK